MQILGELVNILPYLSLVFAAISLLFQKPWSIIAFFLISVFLFLGPPYLYNFTDGPFPIINNTVIQNITNQTCQNISLISYNFTIFGSKETNEIARTGNKICYSFEIKRNDNKTNKIFHLMSYNKFEENENKLTVTEYHTEELSKTFDNKSVISDGKCERLFPGIYSIAILIKNEEIIQNNTISNACINTDYEEIIVYNMQDYIAIKNQRNFTLVILLAAIPTILASIKTLSDIWKMSEKEK